MIKKISLAIAFLLGIYLPFTDIPFLHQEIKDLSEIGISPVDYQEMKIMLNNFPDLNRKFIDAEFGDSEIKDSELAEFEKSFDEICCQSYICSHSNNLSCENQLASNNIFKFFLTEKMWNYLYFILYMFKLFLLYKISLEFTLFGMRFYSQMLTMFENKEQTNDKLALLSGKNDQQSKFMHLNKNMFALLRNSLPYFSYSDHHQFTTVFLQTEIEKSVNIQEIKEPCKGSSNPLNSNKLNPTVKESVEETSLQSLNFSTERKCSFNVSTIKTKTVIESTSTLSTDETSIEVNLKSPMTETVEKSSQKTPMVESVEESNLKSLKVETVGESNVKSLKVETVGESNLKPLTVETVGQSNLKLPRVETVGQSNLKLPRVETVGESNLKLSRVETVEVSDLTSSTDETMREYGLKLPIIEPEEGFSLTLPIIDESSEESTTDSLLLDPVGEFNLKLKMNATVDKSTLKSSKNETVKECESKSPIHKTVGEPNFKSIIFESFDKSKSFELLHKDTIINDHVFPELSAISKVKPCPFQYPVNDEGKGDVKINGNGKIHDKIVIEYKNLLHSNRLDIVNAKRRFKIKTFHKTEIPNESWIKDHSFADIPLEIFILMHAHHKNIISLIKFFQTKAGFYRIFTPYIFGYNLKTFPISHPTMSEGITRKLFLQLAQGIGYLHSHKIIHRDITPENVMIDQTFHLVIVDFSHAVLEPQQDYIFSGCCGTLGFISPEELETQKYQGRPKDIFAMGITMFNLIYNEIPTLTNQGVAMRNLTARFPVSRELEILLQEMTEREPIFRSNMNQILEILNRNETKQIW